MTQPGRIDQITVMRQSQRSLYIIEDKRLGIFSRTAARRRISDMSHADIAFQFFQVSFHERLIQKAHFLYAAHSAFRPFRIADRDAAAFLPSVLQCKKPIINTGSHIVSVKIIDTKNTTLFP